MRNTLLLGNGFSRSVYKDAPDWESLYVGKKEEIGLHNYTYLYEVYLLRDQQSDNQFKRMLVDKLRKFSRGCY